MKKFKGKIALTIAIIVIFFIFLLSIYVIKEEKEEEINRLNNKINRISQLLKHTSIEPLWDIDIQKLKLNLNSIFVDEPEILAIDFFDVTGEIKLKLNKDSKFEIGKSINKTIIIKKEGLKLGEATITYTTAMLERKLNESKIVFTCLILGLLITNAMIVVFSRIKERELRESEERYRLITENIVDVIWTMDMNLNFTYISPSIYQQRGYTVEESLKHSLEDVVLPEYYEKVMSLFTKTFQLIESGDNQGFNPKEFEVQQPCKDGSVIWTSNNASVLHDSKNQPIGILGSTHNITERKQAEEALKVAAEEKKMALVGQIAGQIAHDFNNILGIIMGNAELSLYKCKDTNIRKKLKLIFEQSLRGKNLTRNLVAFAKDQEPKQEFFRVTNKIDLVLKLMKKDLEGISIIKNYESNVPDVLADPGMIEHALVNLIQNSIHAISMVEEPQIIINTFHKDNYIYLEIEDNGCGIPEEVIDRIYELSFTMKGNSDITNSYKSGIKGTGYGMANVKKYIEQHKGNILIDSKAGKGTKITISIPVTEKKLTQREIIEIQKENFHVEKNILLVEDEQAISNVQYTILTHEPCNHKVDIATDAQMAMDLFDRNKYNFVSLDFVLTGELSGMDVYKYIRQQNKTIPILFVSGNLDFLESINELKQKDPCVDHVSKPCQNKDYVNAINKLLEQTSGFL